MLQDRWNIQECLAGQLARFRYLFFWFAAAHHYPKKWPRGTDSHGYLCLSLPSTSRLEASHPLGVKCIIIFKTWPSPAKWCSSAPGWWTAPHGSPCLEAGNALALLEYSCDGLCISALFKWCCCFLQPGDKNGFKNLLVPLSPSSPRPTM